MKFSKYRNNCFVLLLYVAYTCYDIWSNSEAFLIFDEEGEPGLLPMSEQIYAEFTIFSEDCKEVGKGKTI